MHPVSGTGRLPKTERKMHNHYATHNLWQYWMDTFIRDPEDAIFFGIFICPQRRANTPHALFRFVTLNNSKRNSGGKLGHALFCFLNIKDKKQNSRGDQID